jgi:hypothetical protein
MSGKLRCMDRLLARMLISKGTVVAIRASPLRKLGFHRLVITLKRLVESSSTRVYSEEIAVRIV